MAYIQHANIVCWVILNILYPTQEGLLYSCSYLSRGVFLQKKAATPTGTIVDRVPVGIGDSLGESPTSNTGDCDVNSEKSSSESTNGDFSTHSPSVDCEPLGIAVKNRFLIPLVYKDPTLGF